MSAESGWYLDPNRPGTERYWDGLAWTKIARAIGSLTFEVLPPPNAMAEPALEPPLVGVGRNVAHCDCSAWRWHWRSSS
jgi:hypothetical protein